MIDSSFFERPYIKLEYTAWLDDPVLDSVVSILAEYDYAPAFTSHKYNCSNNDNNAFLVFDNPPCPSGHVLSNLLREIDFEGEAFIKKDKELIWRRDFSGR